MTTENRAAPVNNYLLQDGDFAQGIAQVFACPVNEDELLLTAHMVPAPQDAVQEVFPAHACILLTPDGMATLIEQWALQHPDAFDRLTIRVYRAQGENT